MSVGENIKRKRIAMGLSQEELAEAVQVAQSMICQIERGSKVPTITLARDIAKELQCSLDDFVEEE